MAEDAKASPERGHVRGSVALLVGRGMSLLITLATQIVLVRGLTKVEFGAFAYAFTLATAGRQLLTLGQGKMLSRFMAKYEEEEDYGRMFGSMAVTAVTICLTSALMLGAFFVFSQQLTAGTELLSKQILLILALLAPMEALDQVFVSLFAVFSRARSIIFRKYLFTPLIRLLLVVAMVMLNASIFFLAVGYVVTGLIGLAVYWQLLVRELRKRDLLTHFHPRRLTLPVREMVSFSFPTLTTEFVFLSTNTLSVAILAANAGIVEVANFRAVMPMARLNQFVYVTFVTFYLPIVSRLFARRDHEGLRSTYWHSALVLAVFTFPILAMTGPFAHQTTVTLFGERYADSAIVLAVLSVGYYLNAALGFNAFTLQIYGKLRFLTVLNVSAAAANVVLCLMLVPIAGAIGVAVANCAILVGQNLANQIMLSRTLSTPLIDREFVRPYLLIAAAGLFLALISWTLHPGFVLALTISACVSVLLLRFTRHQLQLIETFPEIERVPWLARALH